MKKLFSFVVAILIATTTFAQVDEVTLTVLGSGSSENEAINVALRSAIEQSFGTFVSANTTILNDDLVKDEIVSISKGNIKSYDKLAVSYMPNGNVAVSLKATVSINKLISYAKGKGSRAEFAGQSYAANVKLIKLKVESTKKAIDNMLSQMEIVAEDMFDFELSIEEPSKGMVYSGAKSNEGESVYIIPCTIDVYANVASTNFANIYTNTMKSLNLSEEEKRLCKSNDIEVTNIYVNSFDSNLPCETEEQVTIAGNISIKLHPMVNKAMRRYVIHEIGTNTAFDWRHYDSKTNSPEEFIRVSNGYVGKGGWCLYSNVEKKYLIDPVRRNFGVVTKQGISSFVVPISYEPIKLTKEQKKAQKEGTFQGKTYKEIMGKQKKLTPDDGIKVLLYQRGDLSSFMGYELQGVSAPQNK